MREIDSVWDKGTNSILSIFSVNKLELYTCDVDLDHLEKTIKISANESSDNLTIGDKRKQKFKNKVNAQILKDRVINNKTIIYKKYFDMDNEVKAMRETFKNVSFLLFLEFFSKVRRRVQTVY
jgi:hypothetical protein